MRGHYLCTHGGLSGSLLPNWLLKPDWSLSVGRTASSEPPYASHTLVQINPQFIPKLSTQKYSTQILLSIDRMQMSIFLQKVKEALFGAKMLI